jgi:exportin-5
MMGSVVRRCTWPSDPELAAKGDFLLPATAKGVPAGGAAVPRNPAFFHVAPMLPLAFRILGMMNLLWHEEARTRVHAENRKIYEISDAERNTLLGITVDTSALPEEFSGKVS